RKHWVRSILCHLNHILKLCHSGYKLWNLHVQLVCEVLGNSRRTRSAGNSVLKHSTLATLCVSSFDITRRLQLALDTSQRRPPSGGTQHPWPSPEKLVQVTRFRLQHQKSPVLCSWLFLCPE